MIEKLFSLEGKTAIVTGASQGLGREMALALSEAGADVSIVDIDIENGEKVVEEIKKIGKKAIFIKADVSKEEDIDLMIKKQLKNSEK